MASVNSWGNTGPSSGWGASSGGDSGWGAPASKAADDSCGAPTSAEIDGTVSRTGDDAGYVGKDFDNYNNSGDAFGSYGDGGRASHNCFNCGQEGYVHQPLSSHISTLDAYLNSLTTPQSLKGRLPEPSGVLWCMQCLRKRRPHAKGLPRQASDCLPHVWSRG